jgi:thiol:disulfide interchange protein
MHGLSLSLLFHSLVLAAGAEPYEAAYQKADENGRPLLVLVGADWCPGCRSMKFTVLPRMQHEGKLEGVHLTLVDSDRQAELAGKLMRGGTIPQLIVFTKTAGGWHREQITGAASEAAVEGLIRRAEKAQSVSRMTEISQTATPKAN